MSERTTLAAMLFGLALTGGAVAPPAQGDPPALSAPANTGKADPVAKQLAMPGVVEVDETKLAQIHTRFKGRIDKLHVNITGATVKKGQPLADLYSPDVLVTAQNLTDAQRSGNRELERTARDRLQRWGMDKDQVEEILKSGKPVGLLTVRAPISGYILRKHQVEGAHVEEGALLFGVADLATVWIEAEIKDEADVAFLKDKLPVRVTSKAVPKREFSGELLFLFRNADSPLGLKVRFAVKNPRDELRPGMRALVLLDVPAATQAGPPDKKDAKLKELLKERLATLKAVVKLTSQDYHTGKVSFDRVHQAIRAMLDAELEQCESEKERIAVLEKIVGLAKEQEATTVQRYKSGAAPQSDALLATVGRLEAEIALERARPKVSAQPK